MLYESYKCVTITHTHIYRIRNGIGVSASTPYGNQILAAPLVIQLPAKGLGEAAADDQKAWAQLPTCKIQMKPLPSAQPQLAIAEI